MLSKNNKQLILEKQAAKKQRYGLRKLSIGVASVLLGMTFLGAGSISAAENENLATATTEKQVESVSDPLNGQTEVALTPQTEAEKQSDGQDRDEKTVTRTIDPYKDGEVVDTANTKTYTEERYITRTINIWHDDQLIDTILQEVVFKREVTEDLTTGEKTYGAWDTSTKMFEDFNIPQYEGYKHIEGTVQDRYIANPETENIVNDIKYTSEKEISEETTTEYDTVKRVISIYQDGKKVDEVTQVVEFSREVKKNLATGETEYGEWVAKDGKDIWEAFDAPEYENYTTDTIKIDNKTVKPGMKDEEAAIYYTSKVETRIEYSTVKRVISIYQDGKKVDEVTQVVEFSREVKKNLATGETEYGEWVAKDGKDIWEAFDAPEYENYTTDTVKIDNKTVKPGMEDEAVAIYYTSKVETTTEYDTVKRVISIYQDGKKVDEVTQVVEFSREVKKNLATGETEYGEWVAKDGKDIWEAFDAPEYENYTTDTIKIDNKTVKPGMKDEEAAIYYTSKVETTTEYDTVKRVISIYQDGKKVDEVTQVVEFSREVKKNLATGETEYGEWVAKDGKDIWEAFDAPEYENYTTDTIKIDNETVKPGMADQEVAINYIAKIDTRIEERFVQRTIVFHLPNGETKKVTHDVTFKREVRKNLVTGEEIYGAWGMEKVTFPEYEVPKVENYIPTMDKVEAVVVTPDTQSWTVDVYYEATIETTTEYDTVKRVISIYQDGKKVDEVTQVVEFSREVKKNLATGETEYGEWVAKDGKDIWEAFDAPEYENYTTDTIKIDNKTVKPGMKDEEAAIYYTSKVETRIEYSTVKRVISIYLDGKKVDEKTQSVTFKREVQKNLVTGEETYGEWDRPEDIWAAFDAPEYENYTTDTVKIDNKTVKPGMKDEEAAIYYTSKVETTTEYDTVKRVISIYQDGKKVDEVTQVVEFSREVKKNLATGETEYGEWVAKDGKDIWEAFDAPEYENYTTDTIKIDNKTVKPGMKDEEAAIYYTSKVETRIEYSTVKRVISIYLDGKKVDEKTQSVTFKREVQKNLATGEETYGEWDRPEDIWAAFDAPEYENYTTDTVKIDNKTVKPGMEDEEAAIYYTSKVETTTEYDTVKRVISIYQDGKKVDEVTQVVEFSREVKKNLATGETEYGEWVAKDGKDIWEAFDAPEYENYTTDTIKIDNKTVKPGMKDEEAAIYYTSKVETELEERVVDRTIILNLPNGLKHEHVQSVTFKREVKKNLATGEVTYGEWDLLPTEFEAYIPPTFEGYIPSVEEVGAIIVDPDSPSTTVEVDYYKIDEQVKTVTRTFTVRVVDGILPRSQMALRNGSQIVQTVSFVRTVYVNASNEIVGYGEWKESEQTFDGFAIEQREGYTTRRSAIESQTVTPDSDDIEDEILYVAYATHEDTKVVTRKITIIDPDGKIHVVEQQAIFTRQVLTDQFTGQRTLGDWSVDQSTLEGIALPEFNGYKPSQQVDSLKVSPDSEDSELVIIYEKVNPDAPVAPDTGDDEKPDTPVAPDTGDDEKPDTPVAPDTGDAEKPDTPVAPDTGDAEKPDTPVAPDTGDDEKPDTPVAPDTGDAEKPDTPVAPDTGDDEKPDTPVAPDTGDDEKPDAPTAPDTGDDEKPDTPTAPSNGITDNGTEKDPGVTGDTNNDGLENAKDDLNSKDQILNLSAKSNKDNGAMLKDMESGQASSTDLNTKSLATQNNANIVSELPALGDETEIKSLGALFAMITCTSLFFIAKGKKRKN